MNISDFTYLLQHPSKVVDPTQTRQLEEILADYPYFQAARALHLKGLHNLNSFKYNNALKVTAAYTTDRDILFDFITSADFPQNAIADTISGKTPLKDTEIISEEVVAEPKKDRSMIAESDDEPLPRSVRDADAILDPSLFSSKDPKVDKDIARAKKKTVEDALELGKPLQFTKKEKYSFGEWLQLTNLKTGNKKGSSSNPALQPPKEIHFPIEEEARHKKFELIDRFIATNPKLVADQNRTAPDPLKDNAKLDGNELMTETLAKVYLEQKKFKKAIQAYRILSLKYPEKSGFFADRIKAVEKLQQENTQ